MSEKSLKKEFEEKFVKTINNNGEITFKWCEGNADIIWSWFEYKLAEQRKEFSNLPEHKTAEFANVLLVNALRGLTEEQRHDLTVALTERDSILKKELADEHKKAFNREIEIKEIIYFTLEEITAIDGMLRLNPDSIHNPLLRRKIVNDVFRKTCEKFNIHFTDKELLPEGDEQLKNLAKLIFNEGKESERDK
jgi:hypothetical protein